MASNASNLFSRLYKLCYCTECAGIKHQTRWVREKHLSIFGRLIMTHDMATEVEESSTDESEHNLWGSVSESSIESKSPAVELSEDSVDQSDPEDSNSPQNRTEESSIFASIESEDEFPSNGKACNLCHDSSDDWSVSNDNIDPHQLQDAPGLAASPSTSNDIDLVSEAGSASDDDLNILFSNARDWNDFIDHLYASSDGKKPLFPGSDTTKLQTLACLMLWVTEHPGIS